MHDKWMNEYFPLCGTLFTPTLSDLFLWMIVAISQVLWVCYDRPERWEVNTMVVMEDLHLMGCDAVSSDEKVLFFWRIIMPLSLGVRGSRRFMLCGFLEIRYHRQRTDCLKEDIIGTVQKKFYSLLVMPVHRVMVQRKCLIWFSLDQFQLFSKF